MRRLTFITLAAIVLASCQDVMQPNEVSQPLGPPADPGQPDDPGPPDDPAPPDDPGLPPFVSPSFAYVANQISNTVSVIDAATNTVVATVSLGNPVMDFQLGFVAITPDGDFAYVTNAEANTLSMIETATNTVAFTIPVGSGIGPAGVAITPDGAFAYIANFRLSNTVSVIAIPKNPTAPPRER